MGEASDRLARVNSVKSWIKPKIGLKGKEMVDRMGWSALEEDWPKLQQEIKRLIVDPEISDTVTTTYKGDIDEGTVVLRFANLDDLNSSLPLSEETVIFTRGNEQAWAMVGACNPNVALAVFALSNTIEGIFEARVQEIPEDDIAELQ